MYYDINVAKNGSHFFATSTRSCRTEEEAKKVYKVLREKFPPEEGYEITVTYWENYGRTVTDKFKNMEVK